MRRKYLIHLIAILSLGCQGAELLKNAGFEKGLKFIPGLNKKYPEYWRGGWKEKNIPMLVTGGGAKQGKKFVSCENCSIYQIVKKIIPGKNYCCWFWARGEGKLKVLFYMYGKKPDGKHGGVGAFGYGDKPVLVSSEWCLYKKNATFKENVDSIAVAFHAKGKVEIDNVFFLLDDGIALSQQVTTLQTEWQTQLKQFTATFQKDSAFKNKFSPEINKLSNEISTICEESKRKNNLSPEREYELKQNLERVKKKMRKLIKKIKLAEVLR